MILYIEIGMILMSILEMAIYRNFEQSLLQFINTILKTWLPLHDPYVDQTEYPYIAVALYIFCYICWPIILVAIMQKNTTR